MTLFSYLADSSQQVYYLFAVTKLEKYEKNA